MSGLTLKANDYLDGPPYVFILGFNVVPDSNYLATAPVLPSWAQANAPRMQTPSGGEGPSAYDYTDAATGVQFHAPPPDIEVANPYGPSASYLARTRNLASLPAVGLGCAYLYGSLRVSMCQAMMASFLAVATTATFLGVVPFLVGS